MRNVFSEYEFKQMLYGAGDFCEDSAKKVYNAVSKPIKHPLQRFATYARTRPDSLALDMAFIAPTAAYAFDIISTFIISGKSSAPILDFPISGRIFDFISEGFSPNANMLHRLASIFLGMPAALYAVSHGALAPALTLVGLGRHSLSEDQKINGDL